jgi:hypothetical protein
MEVTNSSEKFVPIYQTARFPTEDGYSRFLENMAPTSRVSGFRVEVDAKYLPETLVIIYRIAVLLR